MEYLIFYGTTIVVFDYSTDKNVNLLDSIFLSKQLSNSSVHKFLVLMMIYFKELPSLIFFNNNQLFKFFFVRLINETIEYIFRVFY